MSLEALDRTVAGLREQSLQKIAAYNAATKAVNANPDLSLEGKARQLQALHGQMFADVAALKGREAAAVAAERQSLEARIGGVPAGGGADLISFRDARDRASSLTDDAAATRAMQDAIATGDTELAKAYLRHSLNMAWTSPVSEYQAAFPNEAQAVEDLFRLRVRENDPKTLLAQAGYYYAPAASEVPRNVSR